MTMTRRLRKFAHWSVVAVAVAGIASLANHAAALSLQQGDEVPHTIREQLDQYRALIPETPDGAVSWDVLGNVVVENVETDGLIDARPRFSEAQRTLDGKEIVVRGFMFPLDQTMQQSRFLLTALPPSCPFCLPAGPSYMIEVTCKKPLEFTYDPVTIRGRFELITDGDMGLYYRMTEAVPAG